jgi:hypothetical protein
MIFVGLGISLCVLAATVPVVSKDQRQPRPDVTAASKFEIVEDTGRVRGEWEVNAKDEAVFSLRSPQGAKAIVLSAGAASSSFVLASPDGTPRIRIEVDNAGDAQIRIVDGEKTLMRFACSAKSAASIVLSDEQGRPRWTVESTPGVGPSMRLLDAEGKAVWSALTEPKREDQQPTAPAK